MAGAKWRSPLSDWKKDNQDPNLAFSLVARNERARQLWADPHNSSRYNPASFVREYRWNNSGRELALTAKDPNIDNEQLSLKEKEDTEPTVEFFFDDWPKNISKGFVLGSCVKHCDVLLGDRGSSISEQMLAFTFNKRHELIMNVTSDKVTSVTFNGQKEAKRMDFSWIFPRGQRTIRVKVANVLEFDVVVPKYGFNKGEFHNKCESFLCAATFGDQLTDNLGISNIAASGQVGGITSHQDPFYLRGRRLGSGAYGAVHKVLQMPDGKIFAAKRFRYHDSFRQEAEMLKKVCKNFHKNIVQFVDEWHGDHKPILIMEYVAGGNIIPQMVDGMEFGDVANLASQILDALVFLHDQGVMHRDIKPANILCVTSNQYKLADFGASREMASLLSKQGTVDYMAPEVHEIASYSYTADIWSLGVVLFYCMETPRDSLPGLVGRKWCKAVFSDFMLYYQQCLKESRRGGCDVPEVVLLIKNAMLKMDPDDRLSARECFEGYQDLWESLDCGEGSGAGSGANTPRQAHPNGSFPPGSLGSSEGEETADETSLTVRSNGGDPSEKERQPQHFRNEERTTVVNHPKAGPSLHGNISPPNESIGRGALYDPAHDFHSIESTSKSEPNTNRISKGNKKRQRDSHASAQGGETNVTPQFPRKRCTSCPATDRKRLRTSASEPTDSAAQGGLMARSQSSNVAGHSA